MPIQKKILIATPEFEKETQTNHLKFEDHVISLISSANKFYNKIYLESKTNLDIKKFSACKKKFNDIKLVIESKKIFTPLINKLYIEAWISTLYSDKHALNLEPKTEKQLTILNEKIQEIGSEFNQLLIKKSSLELKDERNIFLLNYIDDFEYFWKTIEKRLLADGTFNFAETLVKQTNFEHALHYFEKAKNLYAEAASNAADNTTHKKSLKFSKQTVARLKEIKNKHLEKCSNKIEKTLPILFQRLSESSEWTIVNKPSLAPSIKRKANETLVYSKTKKQKINVWDIQCEKILEKFRDYKIDINLNKIKLKIGSFSMRKAIAHNNYAIFLIENLNSLEKNYCHSEKVKFLNKAITLLTKSKEIYENANLVAEKNKIRCCIDTVRSSLKSVKTDINQINKVVNSPSMKTPALLTNPRTVSKDLRAYQPILSDRKISMMFKEFVMGDCKANNSKSSFTLGLARSSK